jgi:hypothetical protein
MTLAGCPMYPTTIYKIEKGEKGKRRRITVDELVAFSRVFGIGVEELLALPGDNVVNFLEVRFAMMNEKIRQYREADAEAEALRTRATKLRTECDTARRWLFLALDEASPGLRNAWLSELSGAEAEGVRRGYRAHRRNPKKSAEVTIEYVAATEDGDDHGQ